MAQEIDAVITVFATADPKEPNGIKFRAESQLGNGNVLTFKNPKKGDTFKMQFELEDGNLGLSFLPDPDDAFWVLRGSQCPEAPASDKQFEPKQVLKGGKTLVVKNKNSEEAEYRYTLRFQKADGAIVPWDPIIINSNGGSNFDPPPIETVAVAVGGTLATLLAFLGLKRLLGRKGDPRR